MPKNDRCPDCKVKWDEHFEFDPHPSEWLAGDFLAEVERQAQAARRSRKDAFRLVAPRLLWEMAAHGLPVDVQRQLVLMTWGLGETPLRTLGRDRWVKMFRRVGYTEIDQARVESGQGATAEVVPEIPRTLYRGASPQWRHGMSWTPTRRVAEVFAWGRQEMTGETTFVYELVNPPADRVLARLALTEWGADEWVVDTQGLSLRVHKVDPPRWFDCDCGSKHWGQHGAAGLLLARRKGDRVTRVLMQRRAGWSHHGGTWGLPGGALESGEDGRTAALREAVEETGIDVSALDVVGEFRDDSHGADWHYTTVLAVTDRKLATNTDSPETEELRWVRLDDVDSLDLHPGFAKTWPEMRARLEMADK